MKHNFISSDLPDAFNRIVDSLLILSADLYVILEEEYNFEIGHVEET